MPTELHHLPGTFHGFDAIAPDSPTAREAAACYLDALRRALLAPSADSRVAPPADSRA